MRVLLIHPVYKNYKLTEPLGLCYIASYLRSKGFDTTILDPRIKSMDCKGTLEYLKPTIQSYGMVGISCTDYYHDEIIQTIQGLRDIGFTGHITLGGFGPTTNYKEFARMGANSIIIGEGEETFYELSSKIEAEESWHDIDGIAYEENGSVIRNKNRELIRDLDSLPFPSREIYIKAVEKYSSKLISPQIQGSRGCYMKCSFCSTPDYLKGQGGNSYRLRSIQSVVDEISKLNAILGVTDFEFVDDNFLPPDKSLALKRVLEFRDELKKRNLKISFFMQFRPEYVSLEVLHALKEAGMTRFFLGLESINPEDLSLYNRTYNREQVEHCFDTIFQSGYSTSLTAKHRLRYGYINFNPLSTLDKLEQSGLFFQKYGLTYKKLAKKLLLFDNKRPIYNKILEAFPDFSEENQFKCKRVGVFYKCLSEYYSKYAVERDRYRVIEKTLTKRNDQGEDFKYVLSVRQSLDEMAFDVYMTGISISRKEDYEKELDLYFNHKVEELTSVINNNQSKLDNLFNKLNIKRTNDMFF